MMTMMMMVRMMLSADLCAEGSLTGVRKHYHSLSYSWKLCKYKIIFSIVSAIRTITVTGGPLKLQQILSNLKQRMKSE